MIKMKLGHNGSQHIDELQLNENQAKDFVVIFLKPEVERHLGAIKTCKSQLKNWKDNEVIKLAYESSITGHLQDIEVTEKCIEQLRKKWNWDGEI